jgi:tetratricopeptide (TPR) repeat protein
MSNPIVIVSLLFHLGIFIYAIYHFRKKTLLSYAILIYLGSIAMFANIVKPAPGIVADRWLFAPSVGFSIALGYALYLVFRANPSVTSIGRRKLTGIVLVLLVLLIPYTAKTIIRNKDWNTEFTLYQADMPYLYNSVKANDLYANEIMEWVNKELSKPVNVTKFIEPQIQESIRHYERAVEILPEYWSAWNSLGIIQSRIYKNYDTALVLFRNALLIKPDHPQTWFNIGQAYEGMEMLDSAILFYQENIELDPVTVNTRSRLANLYFRRGEFRKAIELNQEIAEIDPNESLPYVNIGNYYYFQGDTIQAVSYYEKAVEMGAPAVAGQFLSNYYQQMGDLEKAAYYRRIATEQQRRNRYFTPGQD